ncbi:MAG: NAD-glutamate dehydrogenase domain-containing protein, partial [Janthinobacterium lividum]
MTSYTEEKKLDLINKMIETAKARSGADDAQTLLPFLAHYYAHSGAELVGRRSVADLLATASSHWQFASQFQGGAPLVRVYNPTLEEHGWTSRHTVIEIINDDMPFLVDSVTMEINRLGFALRGAIHPVFQVWRNADAKAVKVRTGFEGKNGADTAAAIDAKPRAESFIHFEIDRCNDAAQLAELEKGLTRILSDVRAAVADWPATMAAARTCADELSRHATSNAQAHGEFTEARAFLDWLVGGNFIFLGYRDYRLEKKDGETFLVGEIGSGLGILRGSIPKQDADSTRLPAGADRIIGAASPVFLTKADSRSTVHRPGHLDYVGIKRYSDDGKVIGEHRFLGLYTSGAYVHKPADIPLVRRKVEKVVSLTDFVPNGHLAKAFKTILDEYPRDELLQIEEQELHDIAIGILRLEERQQTRLFVRRDVLGRYASCLIFVPREKYTTDLRVKIQNILMEAFHGVSAEFTPLLSESLLARLHVTIYAQAGGLPQVDIESLEKAIVKASLRWIDGLNDSLLETYGEEKGLSLLRTYANAFPVAFQEDYSAATTVLDIEKMEGLNEEGALAMALYRPNGMAANALRLKLYRVGKPITLSRSLPTLEHMGVKVNNERPYRIGRSDAGPVWMHDFDMETANGDEVDIAQVKAVFEETFARVWAHDAENDDLNRLTLLARMTWREVVVLRAYAKYLRQVGSTFSNAYVEQALITNPAIARQLAHLFAIRFDPALAGDRGMQASALLAEIETALGEVSSLDIDRILRGFLGLIQATMRTNYYQAGADGQPYKPWLSFKFNPAEVPGLPDPKPMFEIWVYSPQVEGVHLRGGKVARGGLRWSDRKEDFRTEVLGLVKAQMVKNAVIVPVGSKGGFVVKNPPPVTDRDAYLNEGIACYRTFLRGLLDLTDNLVNGEVIPPLNVVRHDADDPYLVVAADKGTATFSDYANALSHEYGFWLGDAFASGGSVGYDHKKMGITARGAWESVKRHFWQTGVDTQKEPFTVVGIG